MTIEPDDKDWTWVLERPCPECGFDATGVDVEAMPDLVRANAAAWPPLLAAPDARLRPSDNRWSALEYGCHVRDVFALFDLRLRRMLDEDHPAFDNWNQDVTAAEQRYGEQDPAVVGDELAAAAESCASGWELVGDDDRQRRGDRSDGATFTVETFARYLMHDPTHHLVDVAKGNALLRSIS
ncbi:MAG: DinB family protein [Ilumatobacter sp.]|nr:DinB family protein [Ilumatobacter sp.]